ncbi:DUF1573 domain-containing protein [Bacteroides reticulotermitis]|uniref:DUF1573 domain-containing protein n=2 Tax=Bacteroides reticulotermitis TaxID=1133319 RepID=W4UNF0_9BACE|nr:DUF1573 domain-containing protein [Bacteroides reticulotermitis]MBB4043234.1 hypothetical protein [Bacteroides reticulotermitis]GAE82044.1 hypothetical protein JCM10512_218 [Bacteroides reticulotermitis JCM 10512]
MIKKIIGLLCVFFLMISCKETEKQRFVRLLNEWLGEIVYYPSGMCFTSYSKDSVITKCDKSIFPYTILNYVDSTGCFSCRLQLSKWKELIAEFDSITPHKLDFIFIFNSQDERVLARLLKREHFTNFVYIDEIDTLNKINHFPKDENFQTFLLDKDDRVLAIGNPIHNPKVKELYKKVILGDETFKQIPHKNTTVKKDKSVANLGSFPSEEEVVTEFTLTNTGDTPLVVVDVVTSCGCTTVEYSRKPVLPGKGLKLSIKYKADQPGYFNKSVKVFCNAEKSPLLLNITGNALTD